MREPQELQSEVPGIIGEPLTEWLSFIFSHKQANK